MGRRAVGPSVEAARNRGLNFFATATLAILATSVVHGLQVAPDWRARADEVAFAVVALAAIGWYLSGTHRYRRSPAPVAFLLLALVTRLVSLRVTFGTWLLAGPDFGIALFLGLTALVWAWQAYATRPGR